MKIRCPNHPPSETPPRARTSRRAIACLAMTFAMAVACDSATEPGPSGSPANVAIVSGDNQLGATGADLTHRLVVRVADSGGSPISGASVQWAVLAGAGSVNPATATTNAQGRAETTWTLGASPGEQQVTAAVAELSPVTFTADARQTEICPGSSTLTEPVVLPDLGTPYRITCTLVVRTSLHIDAGVTVAFAAGAGLIIQPEGWLVAAGTASDTIRFLGEDPSRGSWRGLDIRSDSSGNELRYVEIAHGGSAALSGNIIVAAGARIAVANSLIRDSGAWGIRLATFGELSGFAANEFRDNEQAALWIPTRQIGSLDDASTYVGGNGMDVIDVQATAVETDQTWPRTDAPFLMESANHTIRAAVTVQPGAHFRFIGGAPNDRLIVDDDGQLTAIGTAADRIVFTGQQLVPGHWGGIQINSEGNQMAFVDVTHGGSYQNRGNIYVFDGSLSLTASNITASSSFGIYLRLNRDQLSGAGSVCSGNADGQIRYPDPITGEERLDDCS